MQRAQSCGLRCENRHRALAGEAILASAMLLVAKPRLRHSLALHLFADMRNLLVGIPGLIVSLAAGASVSEQIEMASSYSGGIEDG
ncbi:unnamed protein product [Urochloa humidicola]